MKVTGSLSTSLVPSLMFFSLLVLGLPLSGFASEPHVCINGGIATTWQNLGSTTQISWGYDAGCSHSSTTSAWKFYVMNYNYPYQTYCSDDNGGTGYLIPPDTELHTVTCTIPSGAAVRLKARVYYQTDINTTTWMYFDDYLTNQ